MSCRRVRRLLAFRREWTPREEQIAGQHLAVCAACRSLAREYELMDRRLSRLPEPVSPLVMPAAVHRMGSLAQPHQQRGEPVAAPRPASKALLFLALMAATVLVVTVWSTVPASPTARLMPEGPGTGGVAQTSAEAAPSTVEVIPLPDTGRYWGYAVQEGDTLRFISRQVGVSVEALEAANGSKDLRMLKVGDVIWIPFRAEHSSLMPVARVQAITYAVQARDSVWSIARAFGLEPESVLWSNPQLEGLPDMIAVGDVLVIPPVDGIWYTVQEGDTLKGVAEAHLTTVDKIVSFEPNGLGGPDATLAPGREIMIPDGRETTTPWHAYYPLADLYRAPDTVPQGNGIFAWPAEGLLSQSYWSGHLAMDIANRTGTPVYAADDGYVTLSGRDTWGYGNQVVIDHGNGYLTRYAQLDTILVRAGDSVAEGQQIGTMGSTGRSTGPHLHFEVIHDGSPVDPMGLLP
jgi:murein DD-endopeptidase MepM/ murein hydrolase activator NlpD